MCIICQGVAQVQISPLPGAAAAWEPQITYADLSGLQLSRAQHPRHLLANLAILATLTIEKCCAILSCSWSTRVDIMSTGVEVCSTAG